MLKKLVSSTHNEHYFNFSYFNFFKRIFIGMILLSIAIILTHLLVIKENENFFIQNFNFDIQNKKLAKIIYFVHQQEYSSEMIDQKLYNSTENILDIKHNVNVSMNHQLMDILGSINNKEKSHYIKILNAVEEDLHS